MFPNRFNKNYKENVGMDEERIQKEKKVLRKTMITLLDEFSVNEKKVARAAKKIERKLLESDIYKKTEAIFSFIAAAGEVPTYGIIKRAFADGKRVAVPRIIDRDGVMDFFYLDKTIPLKMQLEIGAFGILAPSLDAEKVPVESFPHGGLFLLPGLAFTHDGKRLGKGKAFYDKYIARIEHTVPTLAALCFLCQIVDDIPCAETDKLMEYIVCEKGVVKCT